MLSIRLRHRKVREADNVKKRRSETAIWFFAPAFYRFGYGLLMIFLAKQSWCFVARHFSIAPFALALRTLAEAVAAFFGARLYFVNLPNAAGEFSALSCACPKRSAGSARLLRTLTGNRLSRRPRHLGSRIQI